MFSRRKSAMKVPQCGCVPAEGARGGRPHATARSPRRRPSALERVDHLEDAGEAERVVALDAAEVVDQRSRPGVLGDIPLEANRPRPGGQGTERGAALE